MTKEMSVYLDLIRFTSAMTVFLGHAAGKMTGGFLWQLNDYFTAAVMVFFVLSGYVIAFVFDSKDDTLSSYSTARLSRFTSVAIPALIITLIADALGMHFNPDHYFGGPWPSPQPELLNYVLSSVFLHNIWGWNLNPGSNVPFWSLTYELGFYFLFAFFVYLKGYARIASLTICALVVGPNIVMYFPIWLAGVGIYYVHKKCRNVHFALALSLFVTSSLAFVLLVPWIRENTHYTPTFFIGEHNVLADYLYALIFAVQLFSANYVVKFLALLLPFKTLIVWLAGCTFSLYLFHLPLIMFFASLQVGPAEGIVSRVFVLSATLVIVFTVGKWAENQRFVVKNAMTTWLYHINKRLEFTARKK